LLFTVENKTYVMNMLKKTTVLDLTWLADILATGTCFIQKIYASSSSLLQGKYLPFSPSPLRLNIFRLFVILSLTQLYRYTPEIFQTNWTRIFSERRFVYFSVIETDTTTSGLRWIFHMHSEFSRPAMCNNAFMIISSQM
jgi:hypothetical protein